MTQLDIKDDATARKTFRHCQLLVEGTYEMIQLAADLDLPDECTVRILLPAIFAKAALEELSAKLVQADDPKRKPDADKIPVIVAKQAWKATRPVIQLLLSLVPTWPDIARHVAAQANQKPSIMDPTQIKQMLDGKITPPTAPAFYPSLLAFSMLARIFHHTKRTLRARRDDPKIEASAMLDEQWSHTTYNVAARAYNNIYPKSARHDALEGLEANETHNNQSKQTRMSAASTMTSAGTPREEVSPTTLLEPPYVDPIATASSCACVRSSGYSYMRPEDDDWVVTDKDA